ncbi:hypothetical protein H4582DRAFT_2021841, partial [Lactarius indigo]
MDRNEPRFEKFESEPPSKTVSRSPRNNRGKPETAKEVTTFLPRKLVTRETSIYEQLSPEQIAIEIRRMDATARRKIIARILNIDELTLKQIATKLRGADVSTRRKVVSQLAEKLESERKDENNGSDEGTAVKALTIHMPVEEHHNKVAKLALETLNNPDNQSEKRNETPDGRIKTDKDASTK